MKNIHDIKPDVIPYHMPALLYYITYNPNGYARIRNGNFEWKGNAGWKPINLSVIDRATIERIWMENGRPKPDISQIKWSQDILTPLIRSYP